MADRHSLGILSLVHQYEDFLDSIHHVVDMGCGFGEDTNWWATLQNNNNPPEPYNFNVFAVDIDNTKLARISERKNIQKINRPFDADYLFPVPIDFIWAHDCLQYSTNPLHTLSQWNSYMQENAMLVVSVPQHTGIEYGRQYSRGYSGCYYHYTPLMLIYMLAVNGFDCRDAYLLKKFQDPWIQLAVYKSNVPVMDPQTTTWFDLAEKNLLHPSIVNSLTANGFVKQEEIVMPWLDKELYFIDYISQGTDPPSPTEHTGVVNNEFERSNITKLDQPQEVKITTKLFKPKPLITTPPTRKSYRNA